MSYKHQQLTSMNKKRILILTATVITSQILGVRFSGAQELYPAFVNAVSISTNHAGLVYQGFDNRDIIMNCAAEKGITNLAGLTLVYNRTGDELEVVSGTNHTLVCTPLTFQGGVSLSNTNHTKVERLAYVLLENSANQTGTLTATERFVYGPTNQILHFQLVGSLQVFQPAQGTNSAAIIRGSVVAGSLFGREDGEGDQDHQGGDQQGGNQHGGGRHRGHGRN